MLRTLSLIVTQIQLNGWFVAFDGVKETGENASGALLLKTPGAVSSQDLGDRTDKYVHQPYEAKP